MRPSIIFEAVKVKISENVLKPMERVDAGLQDRNIYDPSLEWHSVGLYLSKDNAIIIFKSTFFK